MGTIVKSKNLWALVGLSALFWGIAPWFPRPYVFDVVNALSIAGAIGVIVMYYPSVAKTTGSWAWVFYNNLTGAHYFIIGLLGFVSYILARHLYNAIWRWLGKPDWMQDSLIVAFMVYGTAVIATMHLLSRDMHEGKIPNDNWRWVGIFTALGVALGGIFIAFLDPPVSIAFDVFR